MVTFFVVAWCGVAGAAFVVNVEWMVVKDGVDGAVLSFPIELDIILSRGVDGNVSSSWNARSNALSK